MDKNSYIFIIDFLHLSFILIVFFFQKILILSFNKLDDEIKTLIDFIKIFSYYIISKTLFIVLNNFKKHKKIKITF